MRKNILIGVALTPILAIIGALLVYPSITGYTAVAIKGPSMGDTIPIGSLAYIDRTAQPAEGMIVTFLSGSEYVTHRLVSDITGNGDLWTTKGDANAERDDYFVETDNIIGEVVSYIPVLGTVRQALEQTEVIAFVILLALIILFWPLLWGTEENPLQRTTVAEGK